MNEVTIIPAGYRLTVVSWENDADNYQTKVLEGLTEARAKFLLEVAKNFSSGHRSGGVGNMYEPEEKELELVRKAAKEVFKKFPEFYESTDESAHVDIFIDVANDLGLTGSDFFTRVLDSFKVEFVPAPIVMNDVTKDFE